MANVGQIEGEVGLDTKDLSKGVKQAERELSAMRNASEKTDKALLQLESEVDSNSQAFRRLDRSVDEMKTNFKALERRLNSVESEMQGTSASGLRLEDVFAGSFASDLAMAALEGVADMAGEAAQQLQEYADRATEVARSSKALDVDPQKYQVLLGVFERANMEADDLRDAMSVLAERSFDALANQTGGVADDFRSLGIAMDELKGKSPAELLDLVMTKMEGMEDATRRAKAQEALLGGEFQRLNQLIAGSDKSLSEWKQEVKESGEIMSGDALKAGKELNEGLDDLWSSVQSLKNTLSSEFGPALISIANNIADVLIPALKIAAPVFGTVLRVVEALFDAAGWLSGLLGGTFATNVDLAGGEVDTLGTASDAAARSQNNLASSADDAKVGLKRQAEAAKEAKTRIQQLREEIEKLEGKLDRQESTPTFAQNPEDRIFSRLGEKETRRKSIEARAEVAPEFLKEAEPVRREIQSRVEAFRYDLSVAQRDVERITGGQSLPGDSSIEQVRNLGLSDEQRTTLAAALKRRRVASERLKSTNQEMAQLKKAISKYKKALEEAEKRGLLDDTATTTGAGSGGGTSTTVGTDKPIKTRDEEMAEFKKKWDRLNKTTDTSGGRVVGTGLAPVGPGRTAMDPFGKAFDRNAAEAKRQMESRGGQRQSGPSEMTSKFTESLFAGSLEDVSGIVGESAGMADELTGSFIELSKAMGASDDKAQKAQAAMDGIFGAAGGAAKLGTGIASGNIMGAIGGGVDIISSIAGAVAKGQVVGDDNEEGLDKEANRNRFIEDLADNLGKVIEDRLGDRQQVFVDASGALIGNRRQVGRELANLIADEMENR